MNGNYNGTLTQIQFASLKLKMSKHIFWLGARLINGQLKKLACLVCAKSEAKGPNSKILHCTVWYF